MRTRLPLAAAVFALLSPLALAGEEAGWCDCQSMCPLAKEANQRRSTGSEAVLASKAVQKQEIARVVRNLARV
jgi:hypothetical protein